MDWMIRPRARESDSAIGTLCGRVLAGGARHPRADGVADHDPTYWLRGQPDGGRRRMRIRSERTLGIH
jgi:hypothetical protein